MGAACTTTRRRCHRRRTHQPHSRLGDRPSIPSPAPPRHTHAPLASRLSTALAVPFLSVPARPALAPPCSLTLSSSRVSGVPCSSSSWLYPCVSVCLSVCLSLLDTCTSFA